MKELTNKAHSNYTIRKVGDNYGLYFKGQLVEVFATRQTAEKWKRISEDERRRRIKEMAS